MCHDNWQNCYPFDHFYRLKNVIIPRGENESMRNILKSSGKIHTVFLIFLHVFVPILSTLNVDGAFLNLLQTMVYIWRQSLQRSTRLIDLDKLKISIKQFMKRAQKMLPEEIFTTIFHLMWHLHEDQKDFGPCWSHVMFSVEGYDF